jgi:endonuclease/exonuclease/phosphatase (EEP) superfamily protein YafD
VIAPHDDNSTPVGMLYQAFAVSSGLCDAQARWIPHGTWPAVLPPWASLSIDHIWLSRKLLLVDSGVGPAVGTLHRPVWASVCVQR